MVYSFLSLSFNYLLSASSTTPSSSPAQSQNYDWFQTPFAIILLSIIIPTLMWLITPQDIRRKLKLVFSTWKNKIKIVELEENIKKLKLGISNENQLTIEEFVKTYRYVFFPVVPNKSPNIIHITFINAVKGLEKLGLRVYVFIYDDYFCKVRGYNIRERKTYIANFSKRLQEMGIKKSQIVYESSIIKSKPKTNKMINHFLDIASKMTVGEIDALSIVNSHYLTIDSKYIRKFKSLLNMTYPACVSSKIGFVLSGKDEKKLWETYVQRIDNGIVHLYIDALYNKTGGLGNVLDDENLSHEDSVEIIRDKISKLLTAQQAYNKDSSIFYLLNHNFFNFGKQIEFDENGSILKIISVEKLIEYCEEQSKNGGIKRETLDILSATAYQIFHLTGGL